MKRLFVAIALLMCCAGASVAQRGKADPDFYPMGYAGDTWTGEVTAFDNEQRTLTLTHIKDKKEVTFVATIPDAPYEWRRDMQNFRVVDFPYDKTASNQTFKYVGRGDGAAVLSPVGPSTGIQKRNNPPAENVITDFKDFMGRKVTVYYTPGERTTGNGKEKYNDVWRIRILGGKK